MPGTEPMPTVPTLDLTPQVITNLVDELHDYHALKVQTSCRHPFSSAGREHAGSAIPRNASLSMHLTQIET
jgi:hypothetical protein